VNVEGELRRPLPAEQALAGQPGGHPLVHLDCRHGGDTADHGMGVLAGLQQARDERQLECADRHRLVLVVDQGDELLG
jgi:hypothetical protein